jgi:hypothetical protein
MIYCFGSRCRRVAVLNRKVSIFGFGWQPLELKQPIHAQKPQVLVYLRFGFNFCTCGKVCVSPFYWNIDSPIFLAWFLRIGKQYILNKQGIF